MDRRSLACMTLAVLLLLITLPGTAVPLPADTDNLDGTGTISWDFGTPEDYLLDNATVSDGAASLSTYESFWLRDDYQDFAGGVQISSVNISGSGVLSLDVAAPAELVQNGNFTDPDNGFNEVEPSWWRHEKFGNSTTSQEYRSTTGGHLDDGYCWRNWHVDNSNAEGYAMSIWLNQTLNLTTMPLTVNFSAFHRFDNQSHPSTPGLNASILLTHLDSNTTTVLAGTGWYNSTDPDYRQLWSEDRDAFSGLGLYNISLLTTFDTMGKASDMTSSPPAGLLHFWDDASILYTAHSQAGTYVSEVLDAGSYAFWKNISWEQDLPPGTEIEVFARTGNSSVSTDSIWSDWSPALTGSSGSPIERPIGRYLQYRVELGTADTSLTPALRNLNITYEKYFLGGVAETRDYKPAGLVRWGYFTHTEEARGQGVAYQYSVDSGLSWARVPADGDLRNVDAAADSGIRLRVVLNTTDTVVTPASMGMELTYVSRVPAFTLEPVWAVEGASPGETVRLNIYFNNTEPGVSRAAWLNVYLDDRLEYLSNNSHTLEILSGYISDSNPGIRKYVLATIPPGQNMFWMEARIRPGAIDGDMLRTTATLDYEDPLGNRVGSLLSQSQLRVNGPVVTAKVVMANSGADVNETVSGMLYVNNTGSGLAPMVWINATRDDRLDLPEDAWIVANLSGNSMHVIEFNATLNENAVQGSRVPVAISVAYSDRAGFVSASGSDTAGIDARLRSRLKLVITSQASTVNSGDMIVFTVHFNNTGFGSAEIVKLNMTIPSGLEFVSSSEEHILSGRRCFWEIENVGPGPRSFTVTMRANKPDADLASIFIVLHMQVTDPVDGVRQSVESHGPAVSVARVYTFREKIYWPWSGLAMTIIGTLVAAGLWHAFKPEPPSINDAFVIYRDGRMISHRTSGKGKESELDGDLVGAMLTAVQQFISDSISGDKTEKVNKLEFGEKELYLERGEHITLILIYTGSMNRKLQAHIGGLVKRVETEHAFLAEWDGRMTKLQDVDFLLDEMIRNWQNVNYQP